MSTRRLDDAELARKDAVDLARTIVRYKHRVDMRHELNDIEADLNADFDKAIASGKQYELNAGELIDRLDK